MEALGKTSILYLNALHVFTYHKFNFEYDSQGLHSKGKAESPALEVSFMLLCKIFAGGYVIK